MATTGRLKHRVAILPWGDAIEDFLDALGVTLDEFRDEMSGGWLFGYVDALRRAGVDAAVVCVSRDRRAPVTWRHGPTGAELIVLPLPRGYRRVRRLLGDAYAHEVVPSAGGPLRLVAAQGAHQVAGYLSTPVPALARALRRGGFTALLCQEYEYQRFDVCALARAVLGVPVYATFQGGAAPRTRLERIIRPLAMRLGAGYVVGSRAEAGRIRHRYGVPSSRIHDVFNPLDVRAWTHGARTAAREELRVPDGTVVVGWHGRIDIHRKGLDVLLHAWRLLRDRPGLPDRRLLMIGSGADAAELGRRLAELGTHDVTWLDQYVLDKRRVADLLSAADLYAFPSRHEGFPVAPLEAMAAGLPLVAADAPGVAEILPAGERSGGVIVPREDGRRMADELAALLGDAPRRERMARSARAEVDRLFSPEAVGHALARMLAAGPARD